MKKGDLVFILPCKDYKYGSNLEILKCVSEKIFLEVIAVEGFTVTVLDSMRINTWIFDISEVAPYTSCIICKKEKDVYRFNGICVCGECFR